MDKYIFRLGFLMFMALCPGFISATEFTVLNYNVQMRPVLDDNDYKGVRISPKLNRFDVVALQESFAGKDLLMSSDLHLYRADFIKKRCIFCLVDSGLSTLSNFPIIEQKTMLYRSWAGIQDGVASKGVLLTRLRINGLIVDVYNTHMIASSNFSDADEARYDQTVQLIDFVRANSPSEHSVIVLGDFNMCPSQKDATDSDRKFKAHMFQMILENLKLNDVFNALAIFQPGEIHRTLFRAGKGHYFWPLSIEQHKALFSDEKGELLSDSPPIVTKFELLTLDKKTLQKTP